MYKILCRPTTWTVLAIIALALCLNIEFRWFLVPCSNEQAADTWNKIILTLSYSYISAVIFHVIVNYLPYKVKQKTMAPYIQRKMKQLKDLLHQAKLSVISPFDFSCEESKYNRESYIELFSQANLTEGTFFDTSKKKTTYLQEIRENVDYTIDQLLAYRDLLTDEQLSFINRIAKSPFITQKLYANDEEGCPGEYKNQKEIGECIFDIYDEARRMIKN